MLCTPLAKIMSKMVLGQTFVAPTLDDFSVDGQIQDNSYKKNPKPTTVANVKNTYTMTKSASASVIPLPRTKVKGLPSAMSSDTANIIKRLTHDGTCEQGIDVMDPFTPEELSNGTAFSFLKFLDRHNIPVKPDIMPINKRYNNLVVRDDILSPLKGSELFPSTLKNVSQVAKNSFYYNEFRFMSTLADISERLIAVPHESRQNILLGELSLLNYNLPANICIPFYCRKESVGKACDHSVMQIVLSESVVLNSSERVIQLSQFLTHKY